VNRAADGKVTDVGRELTVDELVIDTVVVIDPPGRPDIRVTLWVDYRNDLVVIFRSGLVRFSVLNFIKDGKLYDDQDREVHVFEYLGVV
jgi:hypothetical protein